MSLFDGSPGFSVTQLSSVSARLVAHDWDWAADNAAWIAANWERRRAARPALFDGAVLMACACRIEGGDCEVDLFETTYSRFLAHRDAGSPDPTVANAFAAIAPLSSDGAMLLGIMGGHTANAGQVYFPCGTPDLADIRDGGRVDLAGSAEREFAEETGLAPPDGAPEAWSLLRGNGQLAFLRPVGFPEEAASLLARAEAHRRAEAAPELAGFVLARALADIDPAGVQGFARAYLAEAFAGEGAPALSAPRRWP